MPARPCPQACRASSLGSEHLTTCGISLDATSLRGPFSPSDVDIRDSVIFSYWGFKLLRKVLRKSPHTSSREANLALKYCLVLGY